jgi:hypothetical protein
VPAGSTVAPSTLIGAASDAANGSPLLFVFELTVWSIVTVRRVPAGITTGGGAGGGAGWLWALFAAGEPAAGELPADELPAGAFAAGAPLLLLEFGFDLLHPPTASRTPIASHRTAVPVLILHLSLPSEMNCGEFRLPRLPILIPAENYHNDLLRLAHSPLAELT